MYTKDESVLRIEATAHNTRGLNCPREFINPPFIVSQLGDILDWKKVIREFNKRFATC